MQYIIFKHIYKMGDLCEIQAILSAKKSYGVHNNLRDADFSYIGFAY